MKLYIDRDRNTFVNSVGFAAPITSVSFKRGDAAQVELIYVSNNTALSATNDKQITFGIKSDGDYDGDYLVSSSGYTTSGSSYILNPNFNTTALSAALSGGLDSLNGMLEVSWSEDAGSTFYSTNTITAVIYNDVIKGGEGSPVANQTLLEWFEETGDTRYPTLTDGKINASVIPDELDVRLSVLKDTRQNLREAVPGDGELVVDSDTKEILVGDGTGKMFRGYQTSPLTFITTSTGAVSAYPYTTIPANWQTNKTILNGLALGSQVTSISANAFDGCSNLTGSLVIPDSVVNIGDYAFRTCAGFSGRLVLPNSLVNIGDYAFRSCSGFSGPLVLPNSVVTIGDYAFYQCTGFSGYLVIPDSVVNIGEAAFDIFFGSGNITNIYANLSSSNFPASALANAGAGNLFITAPFLSSYGGLSASWGSKTVALWDNYPSTT